MCAFVPKYWEYFVWRLSKTIVLTLRFDFTMKYVLSIAVLFYTINKLSADFPKRRSFLDRKSKKLRLFEPF